MKRILFHNSFVYVSALITAIAFTGCQKQTSDAMITATSEEIATAKTGTKPGTYPEVLLKVTINNSGNNVTSDRDLDYSHGSDAVSAKIDQYGNFIFSCGSFDHGPDATPERWLNYDFSDPVFPSSARANERGAFISTIKSAVAPTTFIPLQNLIAGATECITMSMGLYTIANGVVNFHRGTNEDYLNAPTAYVYVTRESENQWTVSPTPPASGGCSTVSNVAALRINTELAGYYYMPFSFTLTKL